MIKMALVLASLLLLGCATQPTPGRAEPPPTDDWTEGALTDDEVAQLDWSGLEPDRSTALGGLVSSLPQLTCTNYTYHWSLISCGGCGACGAGTWRREICLYNAWYVENVYRCAAYRDCNCEAPGCTQGCS